MGYRFIKLFTCASLSLFTSVILLSCSPGKEDSDVTTNSVPERVVSLSPSITAEMIDLGVSDLIVGVTTWHPPLPDSVEIVGTLINPSVEKIILLRPDTILCSKEDSAVQKTEQLKSMKIRIVEFERNGDFEKICSNYINLSRIMGLESEGAVKLDAYRARLKNIQTRVKTRYKKFPPPKIAFFVSHKPLITVSSLSYINQIIEDAGGVNIYADLERPYPFVAAESLISMKPEIIISMTGGGDEFFSEMLKEQKKSLHKKQKIFEIKPDSIALYTPQNYVRSVEEIFSIIEKYNESGSENNDSTQKEENR